MAPQAENDGRQQSPAVAIAVFFCSCAALTAGAGWYCRDAICEHNAFYVLEDPHSSRSFYIGVSYLALLAFLGPLLLLGSLEMLAECLAHHGIGYLCLIMPLLETSAGATFFFSLWCLFAFCRLYDSGQQPSQSMVTQLMFNFIEGTLLRFLLISFDRTPIKKAVWSK